MISHIDPGQLKKLIAFPTETVYGLGASAFDPDAIRSVFDVKGRPADNPLIVHIAHPDAASDFTEVIPASARLLMEHFWPGPLTIVLKKRSEVLDIITAGLDTVAIRMPNHPIALKLLTERGPMVAPSANKSGRPSPTMAAHVREDFGALFEVLDGGNCTLGLESTVVDCTAEPLRILRPGHISAKEISEITGTEVTTKSTNNEPARSPGMKYSHYAPEAAVRWMQSDKDIFHQDVLYLLQKNVSNQTENIISYSGDLQLMAAELYDRFRQADLEGYREVIIEPLPASHPLTPTLNNRIEKAVTG